MKPLSTYSDTRSQTSSIYGGDTFGLRLEDLTILDVMLMRREMMMVTMIESMMVTLM